MFFCFRPVWGYDLSETGPKLLSALRDDGVVIERIAIGAEKMLLST